ncbi:hypothetical protein P5673_001800 [Acropora cervicornis]|uniref:ATP-grasp domain-containing protein n=1 Tax=Acropora cervicornis TaxID=6130 RepID=A0AAD9R4W2_ACRCE|nr:hypothetical protein P5673_001800 [Acropora cervicornis]
MGKIILCIGNSVSYDCHIDSIEKHVKALDSEAKLVRLDIEVDSNFIQINTGGNPEKATSCFVIVDGERIPSESITSVWYFWMPCYPETDNLLEFMGKEFVTTEWGRVIRSLESYLPNARWINPVSSLDLAMRRPHQLLLAQQVGLTVPKSIITNNPAAVEKLFDEVETGRVVFKTLEQLFVPPNTMVFTKEIKREFVTQSPDSISKRPAIYQELVERISELRITIVGDELFVVRISSQVVGENNHRLDWRTCESKMERNCYSKAQIPESAKRRLLEFHKRAGLVFASYDLLERGEDDIVFLECNPCRVAWLWLEKCLSLTVTEHVACYLLGEHNSHE